MNKENHLIQKNSDRIRAILIDKPDTRDNDHALIVAFWQTEKRELLQPYESGYDLTSFLNDFRDFRLTSVSKIIKIRKRVQNEHKETRGMKYYQKHPGMAAAERDTQELLDTLAEIFNPYQAK